MSTQSEGISALDAPKAGFWVRVSAYVVDAILLAIIGAVIRVFFRVVLGNGAGSGVAFLVGVLYFVYFWTKGGQTIGFKRYHLRVVKITGAPLTFFDAIKRFIGLIIAFAVVFVGVMWVGWDANKQGWHDKMAGTFVIRVRALGRAGAEPRAPSLVSP
ncbi:MAG: RDD family protein [Chloroflexota bacterium]